MSWSRRLLVGSFALLLALPAHASRILHAPLEEVVDAAEVVFEARVVAYQETRTPEDVRGYYEVALADAPDVHAWLEYWQPARDRRVTGSGLEQTVRIGRSYVFLVRSSDDPGEPLELLRVEPLEREGIVMSAWRMSLFRRVLSPLPLPMDVER